MSVFFNIAASAFRGVTSGTPPVAQEVILVVDTENFTFDKNSYKGLGQSPDNQLWSQSSVYHNGKSYYVFQQNNNHKNGMIELSAVHGLRPVHITKGPNGMWNEHDRPVIKFQGDRMFVVQEDAHSSNPLTIHKAKNDNEGFFFTPNFRIIDTEAIEYPNLYEIGGKYVLTGQVGNDSAYVVNTAQDLENQAAWTPSGATAYTPILSRKVDEDQRYQLAVSNKHFSTDVVFVSGGRTNGLERVDEEPYWFRLNVFKGRLNADNSMSYYTMDNRLIANGGISTTQLDEGEYFSLPSTQTARVPQNTLDENGNFYSLHEDGNGALMLTIWKTNSATPINRVAVLPDSPTLVGGDRRQVGAGTHVMVFGGKVHIFAKVNNGTRTIIHYYTSNNEGVSWVFQQAIDFGFSVVNLKVPDNYAQIPLGESFLMIAGESTTAENSIANLAVRKVAFDSLSVESNIYDSIASITEASFNASSILNYSIEAGKITNTGLTINTLIDQSPNANNLTSIGSPQIDNSTTPTFITFDGVNDAFSINPATLAANNAYLVLGVVKTVVNNAAPISISNNTVSNSYIVPYLKSDGIYNQHNSSGTVGTVKGDTSPNVEFNVCAWLYRGRQHDVPMWLNGKMQMRNETAAMGQEEGSYTLLTGSTNIEIGRLVRNTTSYYNFQMKHLSAHAVNSEAEILERIKFLGNKYGITLQNAYR